MQSHIPPRYKRPRAVFALVGPFVRVRRPDMIFHMVSQPESLLTVLASIRPLVRVRSHVRDERKGRRKLLVADVALVPLIA